MNKKLLAVAVGAALAGSIGIAQADVQLFGQLDTSIDSHDCQTNCNGYSAYQGYAKGDGSKKLNMNSNFSYFGIKGAEDLGNGIKAIFNATFSYSTVGHGVGGTFNSYGSNSISDNKKWLGLSGDFGAVRAGTVTTPYSDHGAMLDPFYGTSLEANKGGLQSLRLHDEYRAGQFANGLSERTMRYDSPDMNGLSGSAFYTMGRSSFKYGNKHNPFGLGMQYKNGNILAFADWLTSAQGSDVRNKDKAFDLGGRYAMGNIGMFAMYERGGLVYPISSATVSGVTTTTYPGMSSNQWHLGGDFTMGNTMLYAAYGRGSESNVNVPSTGAITYKTVKHRAWTLGAKHNLSARTSVYAGWNSLNRDGDGHSDHFGVGMNLKF